MRCLSSSSFLRSIPTTSMKLDHEMSSRSVGLIFWILDHFDVNPGLSALEADRAALQVVSFDQVNLR